MPPLSITKASLHCALRRLDRADPVATDRFLDLLTDTCSAPRATVPASDLAESELVRLFFTNPILVQLGVSEVSYPAWKVHLTNTDTPAYRWTDALSKIAETWNIQPNESTCRIFISVIITGCNWHLHPLSSPRPSSRTTDAAPNPSAGPLRLRAFGEVTLKHLVHAAHDYSLSARAVLAIGHSATDSHLTLVAAKPGCTPTAAWQHMLAYIGIVHRRRAEPTAASTVCAPTAYDTVSRGLMGRAWSAELSIVARRTHVYSYVMHVVIAARRGGGVEGGVEAGGRFEEGEDAEAEDFVMG